MKLKKQTVTRIRRLATPYDGWKKMWEKASLYHKKSKIDWAILSHKEFMQLKNKTFRGIIARQKDDSWLADTIRKNPTTKNTKKLVAQVKLELQRQIQNAIKNKTNETSSEHIMMYARYNIALHSEHITKMIADVVEMVVFLYYNEPPKKKKRRIFF